jgi:uncharacterized protein YidB (DUF937 family)
MFDQILELVKEHIGNNPQISSAIPADKKEAVNNEIASHVTNGLQNQAESRGGAGGLLSMLQNAVTSGSPVTNAIEGGLISSLASKFGLPPMATGAIAGALPGLLQKFARKAADPNDPSITTESITKSISGKLGGLGNMFNK